MEILFLIILFIMLMFVGYAKTQQGVVRTTGVISLTELNEDEERSVSYKK